MFDEFIFVFLSQQWMNKYIDLIDIVIQWLTKRVTVKLPKKLDPVSEDVDGPAGCNCCYFMYFVQDTERKLATAKTDDMVRRQQVLG